MLRIVATKTVTGQRRFRDSGRYGAAAVTDSGGYEQRRLPIRTVAVTGNRQETVTDSGGCGQWRLRTVMVTGNDGSNSDGCRKSHYGKQKKTAAGQQWRLLGTDKRRLRDSGGYETATVTGSNGYVQRRLQTVAITGNR